jgi:adenine-specific DNA-methyltransferase
MCPLESDPGLSYGPTDTSNALIQGDNVAVLDELASQHSQGVRCIYIDPPYNSSERYAHYDDRLSHQAWLTSIEAVLERLWVLLSSDGSLWISIDDAGVHYLKVLADGLFGRDRFVTTVVWEHRTTRENRRAFSKNHEHVLVYAKDPDAFRKARNQLPPTREQIARYRNPDDDPRGPWQSISANVQAGHATPSQFYEIVAPNGRRHSPPKGRCWALPQAKMEQAIAANEIWFGRNGEGVPRIKRYLLESRLGVTPETLWTADVAGTTLSAKRHLMELVPDQPIFDTPKPEELIARILEIATDPGDLVLDAYLGSGTTAAVAHKLGRSWIGIENGEHAVTHCADRLAQVVAGEQGGISATVRWEGGGGFSFYRHDGSGLLVAA